MIVAGVMSGTSADGINVALAELAGERPRLKLLGHREFPFPAAVRRAILAAMNAERARVADLARLNFLLGHLYAGAVLAAARKFQVKVELIGCHGQTLYHQGEPQAFLGRRLAVTWQTGEGAIIAARVGAPVVSDFRPADMAAGGKGAPLVPFLDYLLCRHERVGRIVQNIGGIANLTAIPAGARPEQVVAFDTGPGNMVIDAVTDRLYGRAYDSGGRIAARGRALDDVMNEIMDQPFFRRRPPKTAGREEFGREFVGALLTRCRRARPEDVVATATALTAHSIADAIRRFVRGNYAEMIVSGGGAKNPTLLRMLGEAVVPPGLKLRRSDEFGLPSQAKEAVAFAVLAYQTWRQRPGNIPSATGASRPAILGKISHP
ncbi:MAG TPA: anhydro-N-acetylmuramic acid kinase [Terriglobales bacterium]|nr:anhydro-N-acetylmuramic acid kinase [Terriglobales bacterium]